MTAAPGNNQLLMELLKGLLEAADKKSLQKYLPGAATEAAPAGGLAGEMEMPEDELLELDGLMPAEEDETEEEA